ncbi:hypothetical protein GCM10022225_06390 [Plantactinospora mayteni]|uniref:FAD-binding domain-containing protein n=1 Tax=Plantactinospora mayteni TaxID=566021 RepID=A0ABQ4ER85_9ACTN|nr:NAD(P)/FAD-dependent oxidoreductase [Plantactinospora mayteni]GIG97129.1 hypothetical protein Pma05_37020 [Plantactinospora mayteni]
MFDFLVVGGRVAGSSTAILLAQHGYRVALVDRDRHPSPTLSTHVFGDWEAFAALDVLDDPRLASAPAIRRFRTDIEGCVTEADMTATPYARALRREVLDQLLIERARSFDTVSWWGDTRVTDLRWQDGGVTGTVLTSDGRQVSLPARYVVGADGRNSYVARAVDAETYLTRPRTRCAYYAYFSGVVPAGLPTLEYYWHGIDVVIVAPCDGELHCVCVMPPESEFAGWRQEHRERFDGLLSAIPTLAPRLAGATQVGPVRGTANLESYLRVPGGPGWALVGDAGAAVHPCIGAGIDHAVVSAGLFAAAAHRHLGAGQPWSAVMADYRSARDARIRPTLEAAIRLARRPPVPPENIPWLRFLLGTPGMSHDVGHRVVDVIRDIAGEEAVGRLAALVGQDVPAAGPPPSANGSAPDGSAPDGSAAGGQVAVGNGRTARGDALAVPAALPGSSPGRSQGEV